MEIKISIIDIFLFFLIGKIKKANRRANPKWIALAGKPLNIPKSNINGNGEAYHNWNNDQIIAIYPTTFKWKPDNLFVGEMSSWIFVSILFKDSLIKEFYTILKKRPNKNRAFLI